MLTADDLRPRFTALTAHLRAHHGIWHPRPFTALPPPWAAELPELAAGVEAGVDPATIEPLRTWLAEAERLAEVGPLPATALPRRAHLERHVPGRKLAQVEGFLGVVLDRFPGPRRWLDWCGGKGHLGRSLAAVTGASVRVLDHDAALCAAGQRMAVGLDVELVQADALAPAAAEHVTGRVALALHACGELHVALLRLAPADGLAFAPCCYARGAGARHQPLSAAGRAAELALDAHDLSLPGRDDVVATARARRVRDRARARRLGFDLLQREVTGVDAYRSVPPFPNAWLDLDFAAFCHRAAELVGLTLPPDLDLAPYAVAGEARLLRVQRYEAVRRPFAAALELWLVLDRALALAEEGRRVEVGRFCPRSVTPRNLMVIAR